MSGDPAGVRTALGALEKTLIICLPALVIVFHWGGFGGVAAFRRPDAQETISVTTVSKIEQTPFFGASRMPARGVRGLAWTTKNPSMSFDCWLEVCTPSTVADREPYQKRITEQNLRRKTTWATR